MGLFQRNTPSTNTHEHARTHVRTCIPASFVSYNLVRIRVTNSEPRILPRYTRTCVVNDPSRLPLAAQATLVHAHRKADTARLLPYATRSSAVGTSRVTMAATCKGRKGGVGVHVKREKLCEGEGEWGGGGRRPKGDVQHHGKRCRETRPLPGNGHARTHVIKEVTSACARHLASCVRAVRSCPHHPHRPPYPHPHLPPRRRPPCPMASQVTCELAQRPFNSLPPPYGPPGPHAPTYPHSALLASVRCPAPGQRDVDGYLPPEDPCRATAGQVG